MTTHSRNLVWISFFVVVCFMLTWMIYVTLRRDVEGPTHTYSAVFTDVTGLRAGSDVRMAGVRVGRVDDVELDGDIARVRFRVQAEQPVYADTKAAVVYQNIIGQRYIGLTKGDAGDTQTLADGAEIPLERTEGSFDVTVLLNGFEPMFTMLDADNRGNLSNALINALQGDSDSVVVLISETSRLAQTMAGPDQVLGDLIDSLNRVTENLADSGDELSGTLTQLRVVVAGLNARRDELVASTGSITTVMARLAGITSAVQPDLQDMLGRQPGMLSVMVDNQDKWAEVGANLPAVLKGVARITGDSTAMSAMPCDFNFTIFNFLKPIIPTIVDAATHGGKRKYTAKCR
ncbi:MlaD family protein [Mycolicibacterium brumae]|nr:MlaD family protein [Mycolicibacterium brumae]RWA20110.1 hypothetical protein MBRU_15870 [Mycolicibacterium brumae DSM 44177]